MMKQGSQEAKPEQGQKVLGRWNNPAIRKGDTRPSYLALAIKGVVPELREERKEKDGSKGGEGINSRSSEGFASL